ncbi:hypothetical protein SAMN05216388_100159 [Halorientalis persicus]|jgi:hypothetical protein|uniref:DUF8009 domain-containing protein n=1 Tax=Halorientalis persicus TaxID=1367881 RepID=A0A1H8CRA7_9EURY|nr:hypothetical protein [Halorientalis persicus]SEM97565.1 hypothetical protein SAMN05216388_100159 [Halorientalis persicus]
MTGSPDPTAINSIAVDAEDVVTALEAGRRSGQDPVLRVTPPFSGRMRARLHRDGATEYDDEPAPIHVAPDALVTESAPVYPTPAQTEDDLREDPTVEYTRERHRERHAEAVDAWREAVTDHFVDTVTLDTPTGPHEVGVTVLG